MRKKTKFYYSSRDKHILLAMGNNSYLVIGHDPSVTDKSDLGKVIQLDLLDLILTSLSLRTYEEIKENINPSFSDFIHHQVTISK